MSCRTRDWSRGRSTPTKVAYLPTFSSMLNEVNVKIKLVRSKDVFCVMSDADCRVMITKAAMFVRKVKLSPSKFLAHAKALESGTA